MQAQRSFPLELPLFASQRELQAHLGSAHSLCSFCNKHFFSAEELWEHVHDNHFTCQLCLRHGAQRHFAAAADLTEHLRYWQQNTQNTNKLLPIGARAVEFNANLLLLASWRHLTEDAIITVTLLQGLFRASALTTLGTNNQGQIARGCYNQPFLLACYVPDTKVVVRTAVTCLCVAHAGLGISCVLLKTVLLRRLTCVLCMLTQEDLGVQRVCISVGAHLFVRSTLHARTYFTARVQLWGKLLQESVLV